MKLNKSNKCTGIEISRGLPFCRQASARYWEIKRLGTVEGLARELGISKPTLIKIALSYDGESE